MGDQARSKNSPGPAFVAAQAGVGLGPSKSSPLSGPLGTLKRRTSGCGECSSTGPAGLVGWSFLAAEGKTHQTLISYKRLKIS